MKKPRYHYPLLAARTFLIGMFLVNIAIAIIGYRILPDQIVSRAYPDYEIGLKNPYSKEYFFGFEAGLSLILLLMGMFLPYISRSGKSSTETGEYWDRKENAEIKWAVMNFCFTICLGVLMLMIARIMIRHFPVNLVVPPRGEAFSLFDSLLVLCMLPLFSYIFPRLMLFCFKQYRLIFGAAVVNGTHEGVEE